MDTSTEQIDLLLANPREQRPVLEDGLSADARDGVPKPKKDESHYRKNRAKDRSDLRWQRWAVIVPEDKKVGDAMLEAIKPLIDLRAEEQGVKPFEYRVSPNMNRKEAGEWLYNVYDTEDIKEQDRPFYLCLLGSPEQASLEFQHTVAHSAYIGRVHFEKPDGTVDLDAYAAYAKKVVKYAREGFTTERPELLYYVAPDGSKATRNAVPKLVSPSFESSQRVIDSGILSAALRQIDANSVDALIAANACFSPNGKPRPSVLFSVSHGLGGSEDDYGSFDAQRMRQGALVLGPKEVLDAEAITGKTFLPGGLWLMFACFGAGTPATSEYHKWLTELAKVGAYRESARAVLTSLTTSGTGFIGALPQAALRNPNGPLAVIGHIDLSWNFSYVNPKNPAESRSAKFTKVLHAMADGVRVGCAHDEITEEFRKANFDLSGMYDLMDGNRIQGRPDTTDPKKLGQIWMLRNDLRGYVVLGDPAARLSQAEPPEGRPVKIAQPTIAEIQTKTPVAISASAKTAAVLALLEGNETPRVIADRTGCSLVQLFAWFETHRALEREKLV